MKTSTVPMFILTSIFLICSIDVHSQENPHNQVTVIELAEALTDASYLHEMMIEKGFSAVDFSDNVVTWVYFENGKALSILQYTFQNDDQSSTELLFAVHLNTNSKFANQFLQDVATYFQIEILKNNANLEGDQVFYGENNGIFVSFQKGSNFMYEFKFTSQQQSGIISDTFIGQTYEASYDETTFFGFLVNTTDCSYEWSCDGKWLYFATKYQNENHFEAVFVAGPFTINSKIVTVKNIPVRLGAKITDFKVSPDQKKIAFYNNWDVYITEFSSKLTSLSEFYEVKKYEKWTDPGRDYNWSPASNELYSSTASFPGQNSFFSLEHNKSFRIPSPITTEEKELYYKTVYQEHGLRKTGKYYERSFEIKTLISDGYYYAKITNEKLRIGTAPTFGEGKAYYSQNPLYNKIYRFGKRTGEWESTNYFPPDIECNDNKEVKIELVTYKMSEDNKGDWGEINKTNKIEKTYKLVFHLK